MGRDRRWDPCIAHRGAEVESFIVDYFGAASGKVLLIAGAGFRPSLHCYCLAVGSGRRVRTGDPVSGEPA